MSYIFRGRLCGYICEECLEPLANVKVRLYRTRRGQNVAALAVASPKDTFAILSDDQVRAKEKSLLGEFETNDAGEFTATLDEKDYNGEAFEVDVYCGNVPHHKPSPNPPPPLQFSVTVVQPLWRRGESGPIAAWEYCLSPRYWCLIRSRFGAWVICGRVVVCDSKAPVPQVKVSAFDADWIQDDPLGSAVTDSNGKFRIDYAAADFRKDIFGFNIELFGGPDLYFKIESLGGDALLTESQASGRAPGRENVGPCYCTELCVQQQPVITHAWFTRIGDFGIYSDIDHLGSGKTTRAVPFGFPGAHGGPDYGFFGNMKLIGDCPTTYPGTAVPMRYRFRYEVDGSGTGLLPMNSGNIVAVVVGDRPIMWDVDGTGPRLTSQPIYVAPGGATTPPGPTPLPGGPGPWPPIPPVILGPDANGWVTMDPAATNFGFSGPLLRMASASIVPGGPPPSPAAGSPVPPADQKVGKKVRIVFEAEPTTGATGLMPTLTNQLENVYINNWSEVLELNLSEFHGPGNNSCSGLTNAIHIEYTADHELMKSWGVGIGSAAVIPPIAPPLPGGNVPRGGSGTRFIDISNAAGWQPCSYTVTLSALRMLTDGENDDNGTSRQLTFCKD